MGTGIPLNKANTNGNSTSSVKERQLKFRKVKPGKFRLYFQIKGNENYDTVCLDEDKKPVTKSKSTYKTLLEQKRYPLDMGATDYWVPIAIGESKKVNKELKSADIKVTPVFPLSFSEEKGARLAHLRSGYLYIFMDGFLWREIQVNKKDPKSGKFIDDWKFYDVNLTLYQGKDERKAIDGVSSQLGAIVIPYKIGEHHNPKIEVCFSHVQWSWDYICKMGGMDKENDPRYIKELQSKYRNVKPVDAIKESRLQLIKLHDYTPTKKSASEIRSSYLMSLKQAYSENKYVSPPGRKIHDKPSRESYVARYFKDMEPHKKNFRPGRAFLEHLHPPKEPAFLNDLINPPKKMSSKRNALRDIYIESDLPALILIDPIDVADTLRFRFKHAVNALVDFEDHIQKEDAVGQYVVKLVEDDEDLEEHLRKGQTGETIKKKLEEFKGERKLITKKAGDRAKILIEYLSKDTLSEKKSDINTLAAAFKDYEVLEAYSEKRKRKQAAQAVELWDLYTDHLEMFQPGINFIYTEGSTRQTTTSKMIAVGFNKQIRAEIKKEKDKIKTLFRSKNVQIISKVPKTDPHSKEDPWHTSKRLFGLTKNFWVILGRLVRKVTKRWNQIFLTSGQFPWRDFPKLIEKIYGLNLKIKDYSMSQFKEIMFKGTLTADNDKEFNRITRMEKARQANNSDTSFKKQGIEIKKKGDADNRPVRIRGVIISYVGDKWHKSKKIVSLIDEKVFSNKYLGNTMLICGVVAMGVTVYDLATTEDKDVFWTMRVVETVLGSAKLVGQLHISFTTISDKVLREVLDAQRMTNGTISPKTNAKGKVLLGKHTADTIGNKMAKIAKLAKTLAVLGVVIEIIVTTRLVLQITTDTDGREFRNSYLTKAAAIGAIGVVGSTLLTVQLFWWGVASISLGVPVIGWILTILAICAAVWMYFTQKSELQSHEYWVRHCIWGLKDYADKNIWPYKNKKITARKKKIKLSQAEVYINYSSMKKSLAHELAEINQILNDFYVKVYWTPGSNVYHSGDKYIYKNGKNNFSHTPKNKGDRPLYLDRVSLVIDIIVPSWNKKMHSDLGISVTGIMKLRTSAMYKLDPELNPYQGKKYQEKREFISNNSKNVSKKYFDYIPAEPHYINPKPRESVGKFTTIRYRIDGFQVHRDYVRKFEIDVRFYPGPTYKIVYPNINGVHIDIDENETNSTTKSMVMDGRLAPIEEKFVSSYLYQKQNKKSE